MKSLLFAGLCALVSLVALTNPAPSASIDQPARLAPESAVAYLEFSQLGPLVERATDPKLYDLLRKSSGFETYLESKDYRQLAAVVALVEGRLGRKWPEIARDLAGSLHLAFDPANEAALLMVRVKKPETFASLHDAMRELIELDAANKGKASPVQSKEYQGVTGWTFGPKEFHATIDDLLIVSNKSEAIKASIDRYRDASQKSIADAPEYKQAREQIESGEAGWGFVKLDAVRQQPKVAKALQEKSNNPPGELLLGGVLEAARRAPVLAGSLHVTGSRWRLRFAMPYDAREVAKSRTWFFGSDPSQAALAPLRPNSTILTLTTYRGLSGLWTGREELFDEATAAKMAQADPQLGLYFGGQDFGTDILGQLSPRMQLVLTRQEFSVDDPTPAIRLPAGALVLEMNEPDKFSNTLLLAYQKVVGIINLVGGQAGKPQLLLGSEDYHGVSISKGTFLADANIDKKAAAIHYNASPACARVGNRFILGSTTKLVRELIDILQKPEAAKATADNTLVEVDLAQTAASLDDNREPLISGNMLKEGHTREQATGDINLLLELLRLVGTAQVRLAAEPHSLVLEAAAGTK